MSAFVGMYQSETEVSYAVDFGRDRESMKKRSRHPDYRRKGSAPTRVNGIHCRRNKRWTWGSGRGARMTNLRAFAGCLALAVASMASTAFGQVNFTFRTINNVGNLANTGTAAGPSSPSGLGSVGYVFNMADKEVTNAQYVEFLNKVDRTGVNPNNVYFSQMSSGTHGGINFNSGAADGSKYTVKSGGPAGRGAQYANMPVNFVSWFSAARFVNWLQNGQLSGTAGTASMENGAYTLSSATSGNVVARNPNAQFFLPTQNEWYKAAFYNGGSSSYTLYQTNSGSAPTATVTNYSLANAGNFNGVSGPGGIAGPTNVGAYVNTQSAYGLYGVLGNVAEYTETAGTPVGGVAQVLSMGGNYANTLSQMDARAIARSLDTTNVTAGFGFRVAAVPEPGTIALAGVGIAGLAGLDWMKRRKKRLAARQAV